MIMCEVGDASSGGLGLVPKRQLYEHTRSTTHNLFSGLCHRELRIAGEHQEIICSRD
jgi:hypothetical protein